jgi:hypothetical protein
VLFGQVSAKILLGFGPIPANAWSVMQNSLSKIVVTVVFMLAIGNALLFAADHAAPSMAPEAALAKLQVGNEHFVTEANSPAKPTRARRLETAKVEMAAEKEFDVTIVNDDVRRAAEELVSLMRTH